MWIEVVVLLPKRSVFSTMVRLPIIPTTVGMLCFVRISLRIGERSACARPQNWWVHTAAVGMLGLTLTDP